MYTHRRYPTSVRSGRSHYGHRPIPAEDQPGGGALNDLKGASIAEIPLIIARFTALRAWTLHHDHGRGRGPAGTVEGHALTAALEHLDALDGWAERQLLTEALTARTAAGALPVLVSAAAAAEAMGHVHGARALRAAVHRAHWRSLRHPPPSAS